MAEPKTQPTGASVEAFLEAVPDPARRADARAAMKLLRKVTGAKPEMWGTSIVGFGRRRLVYASGRELDWPVAAFAPRADRTTFYLTCDLDRHLDLLGRLGRHQRGKGCLHVRRLADVDGAVLEELARCAVAGDEPAGNRASGSRPETKATRKATRAAAPRPRRSAASGARPRARR